ncbi:hypothetical protein [Vibrio pectenicida]|uniref:hypothetical protein n=1 Tax=Vibrio pectenicida TaxID=62763 RepID=UPI001C105843|nr:hypothetical protein [Vibrio pectenicida]
MHLTDKSILSVQLLSGQLCCADEFDDTQDPFYSPHRHEYWMSILFAEFLTAIMALIMLLNYFRDSRPDRAECISNFGT